MKANNKYHDIDPSLALFRILLNLFKADKICIALYYLPVNAKKPCLHFSIYGKIRKTVVPAVDLTHYPDRSKTGQKIKIQNIKKCPHAIRKEFKPQGRLPGSPELPGDSVLAIDLPNYLDNSRDTFYILIDQKVINSVNSKLKTQATDTENIDWHGQIKDYFGLMYPLLENFVKLEYDKLSYTNDLISTLEQSILYNQQLQTEISVLKEKKGVDIITEIKELAAEKSKELEKEVKISNSAIDYIASYKGDENRLKKAVLKAIDTASLIAQARNKKSLEIEPGLILINKSLEDTGATVFSQKRLDKAGALLQKYEDAAQRAQNVGKKITINSIAFHVLPKSISAPAVSDSIKKYRTEIKYLLERKKSEWVLLRTYFRPVFSLIQQN